MFVRCKLIAEGPGPSEAIVSITTAEGHKEEVVLSKRHVDGDVVEIGSPLLIEGEKALIELPRESLSGRWRIWVSNDQIVEPAMAAE